MTVDEHGYTEGLTSYYPNGMPFADQNGDDRYKYSGKELDTTNGLNQYDFEARQQDFALGQFTSIDLMAEKYHSISPYAYCAGNPILYVDPNGEEIWIYFDETIKSKIVQQKVQYKDGKLYNENGSEYKGNNSYATSVLNDLNQLSKDDSTLTDRINDLQSSKNIHTIEMAEKGNSNSPESPKSDKNGISTGSKTKYNPNSNKTSTNDNRLPRVGLAHELLGHGWDSDQGKSDYNKTSTGVYIYEVNAIKIENIVRSKTGTPKRTSYDGKKIPAQLLLNTHQNR